MKEFWLPYGDAELPIAIENEDLCKVIQPKELKAIENPAAYINASLNSYIEKLFSERKIEKTVIIAPKEDNQLKLINELISVIKEKLFEKGLRKESLLVIRFITLEEVFSKSLKIKSKEDFKANNNNPLNKELSFIGESSSGIKLFLNKGIAEADAKILLGKASSSFLFNFFNPFLQSILGLAGEETIAEILNFAALNFNASCNLKGLIKELMNFVSVDLALTLIPNVKGNVANIILGSLNEVLIKEEAFIEEALKIEVEDKASLAIGSAGGEVFDLNFLKALPGLKNLSDIIEDGGTVVYLAECRNGLGFKPMVRKRIEKTRRSIYEGFEGLIQSFIYKILDKVKVYLVSSLPNYYAREILGVKPCETVNAALKIAKLNLKSEKSILILPYASYIIPELKRNAR
jgi:nickel-dependent lactate racemase